MLSSLWNDDVERSSSKTLLELIAESCLDGIGVSHQVFLSTQFTSVYFVMMSCNSELPTFRQRLQQCAPPRTRPCCLQKVLPLHDEEHRLWKLNGRLAGTISLLARGFPRTRRPDFISWRDSLMSRSLSTDGCHRTLPAASV